MQQLGQKLKAKILIYGVIERDTAVSKTPRIISRGDQSEHVGMPTTT
jgi:hypothetical protein